jgi:hypothetical protein
MQDEALFLSVNQTAAQIKWFKLGKQLKENIMQ